MYLRQYKFMKRIHTHYFLCVLRCMGILYILVLLWTLLCIVRAVCLSYAYIIYVLVCMYTRVLCAHVHTYIFM